MEEVGDPDGPGDSLAGGRGTGGRGGDGERKGPKGRGEGRGTRTLKMHAPAFRPLLSGDV